MKLQELLKSIAIQSGVPADNTALKTITDNTSLASIEVEDDLSNLLTQPRLTMEAAKANPELKKHFKKEVFDGIKEEVKRTATELGLSPETLSEFDAVDSDFKRISMLAKKVQSLEAAKVGAGNVDVAKLNKEIERLNGESASIRTEYESKLKSQSDGFETERIDSSLSEMLSNFDYATGVEKDINVQVAKTLLNKNFSEKGLKIVKKDNALTLQTAEGTEYFENNVKVGVKDFASKVLANAKVLSASPPKGTKAAAAPQKSEKFSTESKNGLNFDKAMAGLEE